MDSRIRTIHEQLKSGQITCKQLVKSKLDLLRSNSHNTVNFLLERKALKMADEVDGKIARGEEIALLEGIPFGVKDVFLLKGEKASASSDMLKNYESPYTATAIAKLIAAGAIPVAKENCDAFGHGSTSENTIFGPVLNARDKSLVAGGSSGGSAVNVALGHTLFSIGGDTGGSVRQPAGYNGIYGLKPTYGRISRYGLMAYASSTDCVGPFAATPEDLRIVLNAMSGRDEKDLTTYESEPVSAETLSKSSSFAGAKVGYYKSFIESDAIDSDIKREFLELVKTLKSNGVEVRELDFFEGELLVSAYYAIAMAETASNLARLDGTGYGARSDADSLKEGYLLTRSKNFSGETKRRIVGGNQVLSRGYSDAVYLKANIIRRCVEESFERDFSQVSIIISPVSPVKIPKVGESMSNPLAMYLSDAYTVGFSLGGVPVLTMPAALESGLQITAAKGKEETIFRFVNFLNSILP